MDSTDLVLWTNMNRTGIGLGRGHRPRNHDP